MGQFMGQTKKRHPQGWFFSSINASWLTCYAMFILEQVCYLQQICKRGMQPVQNCHVMIWIIETSVAWEEIIIILRLVPTMDYFATSLGLVTLLLKMEKFKGADHSHIYEKLSYQSLAISTSPSAFKVFFMTLHLDNSWKVSLRPGKYSTQSQNLLNGDIDHFALLTKDMTTYQTSCSSDAPQSSISKVFFVSVHPEHDWVQTHEC